MAKAVICSGGGGGSGSDDCTALKSHVLKGYTAITKDSDDEPAEGTIESMAGRTVTPGLSSQTISCNGKYMTSNIIVSAIPNQRGYAQYAGGWGSAGDYYAMNQIPVGYYTNTSDNKSWAPEIRMLKTTVRSVLGVSAEKIIYGKSIADITGNAQGWYDDDTDIFRNGVFGGWGLKIVSGNGVNFSANTEQGGIQGATPTIETTRQIDFTDISQINLHTTHITGSAGTPYYAKISLLDTGQSYSAASQSPGIGATASFYVPVSAQVKSRIRVEIVCQSSTSQGIRITTIWMSKR